MLPGCKVFVDDPANEVDGAAVAAANVDQPWRLSILF
jgi:hypothetical protein